jgi:hypothetical protein
VSLEERLNALIAKEDGVPESHVTSEYIREQRRRMDKADKDLAFAYRSMPINQLYHDWKCNITPRTRAILEAESAGAIVD